MFDNTILDISDGVADHDYDLREVGNQRSVRSESAAPLDQPATLTIQHQEVGSGIKSVRRSVARFDRVVENEEGEQGTISCYFNVVQPLKVATAAETAKTLTEMVSFLNTAGYTTKFLAGEI